MRLISFIVVFAVADATAQHSGCQENAPTEAAIGGDVACFERQGAALLQTSSRFAHSDPLGLTERSSKRAASTFQTSPEGEADAVSSKDFDVASARGSTAPLNEDGYKEVSKLQSDAEMREFMHRVVSDMGGCIVDDAGFDGIVPFYSGKRGTQSFEALRQEILNAHEKANTWVELIHDGEKRATPDSPMKTLGSDEKAAPGHQDSASLGQKASLASTLHSVGISRKVPEEAGLPVSLHTDGASSAALDEEGGSSFLSEPWNDAKMTHTSSSTWVGTADVNSQKMLPPDRIMGEAIHALSPLQNFGSEEVDNHVVEKVSKAFEPATNNSPKNDTHAVPKAGKSALIHRTNTTQFARSVDIDSDPESVRGSRAPLDEAGYKSVSELNSDAAMTVFVDRVATSMGGRIVDEAGLQGVVPYFSGQRATQNFEALKGEISSAMMTPGAWVLIDEGAAPLDEVGYKAVAAHKNNAEMERFVRRLAEQMNIQVVDEAGLRGILPYYSGEKTIQSFEALSKEVLSAANTRGAWASH